MIKVNLLRSMGMEQGAAGMVVTASAMTPELQRQAAIKVVSILILPLLIYVYERFQASELQTALSQVDAELAQLEQERSKVTDAAPRIEQYTAEKKKIDKQLAEIRAVTQVRLKEVKTLDALQTLVPLKTWFKSIVIDGNSIKLSGYTTSEEGISQLIGGLQTSPLFSGVDMKSAAQETLPTGPAKKFEIEFKYGRMAGE